MIWSNRYGAAPVFSPDGTRVGFCVGFRGTLNVSGSFFDDALVVAPVNNPSSGVTLVEGRAAPGATDGSLLLNPDARLALLNDSRLAFTGQTRVGTSTSPGDSLFVYDSAADMLSRPITAGTPVGSDFVAEAGINSPYVAPNGAGFGYQPVLESAGQAVVFGNNVYATSGQTPAGAPAATSVFVFESTYFGNNGQSYLTEARSFPASRSVDTPIVNGDTKIVGGQVLPNSGFSSVVTDGGASFAAMNEAGRWYARGVNADASGFVVLDGGVIAVTGDVITAGSGETWTAFSGVSVDAAGKFVILGTTSTGAQAAVYDRSLVLARTGDAIGLSDLFIRDFSVDKLSLSNAGDVVFAARLMSGTGAARRQALLAVSVPEPTTALGLAAVGGLLLSRRRR